MADVLLVRHASTSWTGRRYCGRSDPPLSAAGVTAAGRLAVTIAQTAPAGLRIVTSPRRRARQTAAAIASRLASASIEIDDRWAETDFGIAEGLTFEELERVDPAIAQRLAAGDIDIDWPGGETAASLAARVDRAWRELEAGIGGVVVVSHGGPLRIAIALATASSPGLLEVPGPASIWRAPSQA